MTKDEALKLAQRALSNKKATPEVIYAALTAIEAALTQREWIGLTQQDWQDLYVKHHDQHGYGLSSNGYEEAIEAKLKEKNHDQR
jgi:hypothetical protein